MLDQIEEIFAAPGALGRMGALIAASARARGGRAARWVLVYREDFHGRVMDWLADIRRYAPMLDPRLPWKLTSPDTCEVWRVLRGGSWEKSAMYARSAYRFWGNPLVRDSSVGFRLALPPPTGLEP